MYIFVKLNSVLKGSLLLDWAYENVVASTKQK